MRHDNTACPSFSILTVDLEAPKTTRQNSAIIIETQHSVSTRLLLESKYLDSTVFQRGSYVRHTTSLNCRQYTGKGVSNALPGQCPQWMDRRRAIVCQIGYFFQYSHFSESQKRAELDPLVGRLLPTGRMFDTPG